MRILAVEDEKKMAAFLKRGHQQVKVIVTSVYPLEEQRERIRNADAYFDKSDSHDVLLKLVSNLM